MEDKIKSQLSLQDRRIRLGFTQEYFAEKLGVSKATISVIEHDPFHQLTQRYDKVLRRAEVDRWLELGHECVEDIRDLLTKMRNTEVSM